MCVRHVALQYLRYLSYFLVLNHSAAVKQNGYKAGLAAAPSSAVQVSSQPKYYPQLETRNGTARQAGARQLALLSLANAT